MEVLEKKHDFRISAVEQQTSKLRKQADEKQKVIVDELSNEIDRIKLFVEERTQDILDSMNREFMQRVDQEIKH